MRIFGIIAGIVMSLMGGYAYFQDMESFAKIGWLVGIVFILNGLVLTLPAIQKMIQARKEAKKKALEAANQQEAPIKRKRKKKQQQEPEKSNTTVVVRGAVSLVVGIFLFISGITQSLSGMSLLYMVGSCVMFYGWMQFSEIMKLTGKKEDTSAKKKKKPVKKNNAKEEEREVKLDEILCAGISLTLGMMVLWHNRFEGMSPDRLISSSLMMQGVNGVFLTIGTYKKKAKENK